MSTKDRPFPLKATLGIAALTVAAIGAISGQSIGSTPMLMTDTAAAVAAQPDQLDAFAEIARGERPPDHYDLVTPEGTIPVAELALHGRLRAKTDGRWARPEPGELGASYEDSFSEQDMEQRAEAEPVSWPHRGQDEDPGDHIAIASAADSAVRLIDVAAAVATASQY